MPSTNLSSNRRIYVLSIFCLVGGLLVSADSHAQQKTNQKVSDEGKKIQLEVESLKEADTKQEKALAAQEDALAAMQEKLDALLSMKDKEIAARESKIKALQEKVDTLETADASKKESESDRAGEMLARQAVDKEFSRNTEQREKSVSETDDSPFSKRVEQVLEGFLDTSGSYFRAGYGLGDGGRVQTAFKAPGALTKYRLGNETENYGELVLAKNWYDPGTFSLEKYQDGKFSGDGNSSIGRFQMRVSFNHNWETGDVSVGLPEAWATIGNVVSANPTMKFWAGNRFYRRHDVHITDFFYYNMSGLGGGIDDLETRTGKFALAVIADTSHSAVLATVDGEPDPINQAGFTKGNADLRWYDVNILKGNAEFGVAFSWANGGRDMEGNTVDDSFGAALNIIYTNDHFLVDEGTNVFSLQGGTGPAKTFTSGFETWATAAGPMIIHDVDSSYRLRAQEQFTIQPCQYYSMQFVMMYQFTDYDNLFGKQHWGSTGMRPIVHFNQYFGLAFEAGFDYVHTPALSSSGYLAKFTLSPQVALGGKFFSRPVVRPYFTAAIWGDEFQGNMGSYYNNQRYGLSGGITTEVWW